MGLKNMSKIKVCAHRGDSGIHPENTRAAFDSAIELGAEMIEFDVRRTADGKYIVMHDPTVDRTTNGSGSIAEMTFEQIRALDAGGGQQVPTFEEAFGYYEQALLNVHGYPETDEDIDAMSLEIARQFAVGGDDAFRRCFVMSGDPKFLRRIREVDPRIRLGNGYKQGEPNFIDIALAESPCEVLQPRNTIVTPDLVARAHELSLYVNPFFADDETEMRRLIECGVDGILTNYPARLIQVLESM
jgi:glycerophosphoryl diester phosphodiesterase